MVCTVANPLVQPGLETAMNSALQEYLAMIKEKFNPKSPSPDNRPTKPRDFERTCDGMNIETAPLRECKESRNGINITVKSVQTPRHTSREEIPAQQLSYTIKPTFGAVYFRSRTLRTRSSVYPL